MDNFEDLIKELEQIVAKMEKGEISLDESIKLYEQGTLISKKCNDLLDKAEAKVTFLDENKE